MGKLSQAIEVATPEDKHLGNCCNLHVALTDDGVDDEDITAVVGLVYGTASSNITARTLADVGITMGPDTIRKHRNFQCVCCNFHGWVNRGA